MVERRGTSCLTTHRVEGYAHTLTLGRNANCDLTSPATFNHALGATPIARKFVEIIALLANARLHVAVTTYRLPRAQTVSTRLDNRILASSIHTLPARFNQTGFAAAITIHQIFVIALLDGFF